MSIKLTVFDYRVKKIQRELMSNSIRIRDLTLRNMKLVKELQELKLKEGSL
jgi:hypothetical protein